MELRVQLELLDNRQHRQLPRGAIGSLGQAAALYVSKQAVVGQQADGDAVGCCGEDGGVDDGESI